MKQDLLVARLVRAGAVRDPSRLPLVKKSFMREMKQGLLAQLTAPTVEGRLAEALQAVRQKTGKSLRALELEIYVSDSSLSRYLSGRSVPPWQVVESLCRVAGHPPDDLRFLWEEASRQHRAWTGHAEPAAGGSQGFTGEASVASNATEPELSTRCGCCWHRRWAEAALLAATAMLLVALGMWAGARSVHSPDHRLAWTVHDRSLPSA
jgi:transcriptional regulator with XRE-family HTH domain